MNFFKIVGNFVEKHRKLFAFATYISSEVHS